MLIFDTNMAQLAFETSWGVPGSKKYFNNIKITLKKIRIYLGGGTI